MTRREMNEAFGHAAENPQPVELDRLELKLLELYFEVARFRKPAMSGISPLGREEIKGYEELFHVTLTEGEIKLILELDSQYRISMGRELQRDSESRSQRKSTEKEYGEYG